MTFIQILLIVIIFVPLALVFTNRLRMDVAALLIALCLGLLQFFGFGILGAAHTPEDAAKAIQGFGQPVVITLISLFIISQGLNKSGVMQSIARKMVKIGGGSERKLIALFALVTALLSLFMNNLAAGALILPSAMEVSRRSKISPSKLLIPVAYGSLLGGTATYFTTANIIASNLLAIANPPQSVLHILDFTSTGGLIVIAGIIYLAIFGKKLLPDYPQEDFETVNRLTEDDLENLYQVGEQLWSAVIPEGSPLVGITLEESEIGKRFGVVVTAIQRRKNGLIPPTAGFLFNTGDRLFMVGKQKQVESLIELGLEVEPSSPSQALNSSSIHLVEIALAPHAAAEGNSLKELGFRSQYDLTAIALFHQGRYYQAGVANLKLEPGDSLLAVGPRSGIRKLQNCSDFIVLEPDSSDQPINRKQAYFTVGVILAAIAASIAGVPVYLSMLAGALLILLSGVISMQEAYQSVEWQAIFLIAGMYVVSLAMVQTGLANLLGNLILQVVSPFGPLGLAAGSFLMTGLLTQVMGGQVSALVTGPVAISAAIAMGTSPQAIAVATAIGCSATFLTPLAHPVNILMIAPAHYTFQDFFRIGWRLTVISFVMLLVGMILFWGL